MQFSLLGLLVSFFVAATAGAQTYQPGNGASEHFDPGTFDGKFKFSDVYCVTFPSAQNAFSFVEQWYNADAIHLVRVEYPGRFMANIVVSTVPAGRSAAEEVARLRDGERAAERAYGTNYNITDFATQFGPTIGLRIKDVAPGGREGPFPLVRALYRAAKQPIESLSVHRLFVRGPDRFEIAVYQTAPANANDSTEAQMTERLTKFADELVASLQECTAKMPARQAQ